MAPTINLAQATKEHVLAVNRDYVAQPRITYRYAHNQISKFIIWTNFWKFYNMYHPSLRVLLCLEASQCADKKIYRFFFTLQAKKENDMLEIIIHLLLGLYQGSTVR